MQGILRNLIPILALVVGLLIAAAYHRLNASMPPILGFQSRVRAVFWMGGYYPPPYRRLEFTIAAYRVCLGDLHEVDGAGLRAPPLIIFPLDSRLGACYIHL